MSKDQTIEDPTCIIKMMRDFRTCNRTGNSDQVDIDKRGITSLQPLKLSFDDTVLSSGKKRKHDDSIISRSQIKEENEGENLSMLENPWDIRKMKAELLKCKADNINLKSRINKLQSLKKESDLIFENEKISLLRERERDIEKVRALQNQVNSLRKQELESREELSQYKQIMESSKFGLEKKMISLEKENASLEDKLKQVELSLHEKSLNGDRRMSELEEELVVSIDEIGALKELTKSMEEKLAEFSNLKHEFELLEQQFSEAQQRIKELELEQEKTKEAREMLENQQQNLQSLPELEREISILREENMNLREIIHNKLILEEEVMNLRKCQGKMEEWENELTHLKATNTLQESILEQWRKLAADHCVGVAADKAIGSPEYLRIRIETLQQKELLLSADKGQLESRLKAIQQAKSTIDSEMEKSNTQIKKMQITYEQQTNLIKCLRKKLLLVSGERDSYRSQLDAYEKELTVTSPSSFQSSHQQQQTARIEALEKTIEGYRELAERLKTEVEKSAKGIGGVEGNEIIQKLTEERDTLRKEKEQLMKRRDELEIELECRALKGDFNPRKSKVLHFKMNPASQAEKQHENELLKLQQECDRLRERLRLMEEGQTQDLTNVVNLRLTASSTQEVQELKEQIKSYDTMMQRLKEVFKTTSQEFRDACYMLLGYKIDRIETNQYRLTNMYAESENEHFLFQFHHGDMQLLETPYSKTFDEFINLHLKQQDSLPVFLSTVTIDLFKHQTVVSSFTD